MRTFLLVGAGVFWLGAALVAYTDGRHGWSFLILVIGAAVALDRADAE